MLKTGNMTENASLILAAGTQERWNHGNILGLPSIKQLVRVGDEVLIEKIQRQFPDSVVVTKSEEIRQHSLRWFSPEHNDVTLATLFSTRDMWKGWTTILLGDVLYGRNTVKLLKRQKEQIMFYGDKGEIYALKFHFSSSLRMVMTINRIVTSPLFKPKFGKLWNLYRSLNGFDFREQKMGGAFTRVSDCMDFDNKEQYLKYAKSKEVRR